MVYDKEIIFSILLVWNHLKILLSPIVTFNVHISKYDFPMMKKTCSHVVVTGVLKVKKALQNLFWLTLFSLIEKFKP